MMNFLKIILALLALSMSVSGSRGMQKFFEASTSKQIHRRSVQEKDLVEDESLADIQEQNLDNLEWWKKANYYHVYLRSFKDSDGDGNGDLRGLIEKLSYFVAIGVDAILLSPFYSSPMKRGGYDIEHYKKVDPMFGRMEDYDELYQQAKSCGLRVIVEFVPNHSSAQHHWFWCSERVHMFPDLCGKYEDYYIWQDSNQGHYPNNWIPVFGGESAWTWSEIRQQFYFHQFSPDQPDLNFRNPDVREEFKEIARFWLRKADGLRVNDVIHLLEDENLNDEPLNPDWRDGDTPWHRLNHQYTICLPESSELVGEWRRVAHEEEFEGQEKVIMSDSSSATHSLAATRELVKHYGPWPLNKHSDLPSNPKMSLLDRNNFDDSGKIKSVLLKWIKATRKLGWPNENGAMSPWILWATESHDEHRMIDRVGRPYATTFTWIAHMMPGVPMTYYGDELGMRDILPGLIPEKTIEEGYPERLPFRGPISWSYQRPSNGFSSTTNTWLPMSQTEKNVKRMYSDKKEKNDLRLFIQLQQIRKNLLELFSFGDLIFFQTADEESRDQTLALARTHEKFGNLLLLSNLHRRITLVLSDLIPIGKTEIYSKKVENWQIPRQGKIILVNRLDEMVAPFVIDGHEVKLRDLHLAPKQSLLLRY